MNFWQYGIDFVRVREKAGSTMPAVLVQEVEHPGGWSEKRNVSQVRALIPTPTIEGDLVAIDEPFSHHTPPHRPGLPAYDKNFGKYHMCNPARWYAVNPAYVEENDD